MYNNNNNNNNNNPGAAQPLQRWCGKILKKIAGHYIWAKKNITYLVRRYCISSVKNFVDEFTY